MASKEKILILTFMIIAAYSKAQSRYNIVYEQQFGQHFAAENFVAGFHIFDYVDTLYIPKTILKADNDLASIANPTYRFSKLFFINYLLTDYIMTMNHERFGHGYRILEAEGEITEIVYNPPPPFSNLFSYINWEENPNHTVQQELTIRLGGSEANLVLTDILRKNILLDERFNYNYALSYLYGSNDSPGYTAFVNGPDSDPNQYRTRINNFYAGSNLTEDKMKTYGLIALLTDPMNFYAFKAVFYDYLIKGKHSAKVGMINFSNRVKYLPRFRFEITPFGPELVLQNYVKLDEKLFQLNFSKSDGTFESSWRILANAWNIKVGQRLSFNLSGQVWDQPEIEFFKDDIFTRTQGLGGQIITGINYDFISDNHILGVTMQLGYKTGGYSLGEQLNEGFIFRGGLTFKLINKNL